MWRPAYIYISRKRESVIKEESNQLMDYRRRLDTDTSFQLCDAGKTVTSKEYQAAELDKFVNFLRS